MIIFVVDVREDSKKRKYKIFLHLFHTNAYGQLVHVFLCTGWPYADQNLYLVLRLYSRSRVHLT